MGTLAEGPERAKAQVKGVYCIPQPAGSVAVLQQWSFSCGEKVIEEFQAREP